MMTEQGWQIGQGSLGRVEPVTAWYESRLNLPRGLGLLKTQKEAGGMSLC